MKRKTKNKISITINKNITEYLNGNIENKSKYIEYLIYQDLKLNEKLKKEIYII